MPVAPPERKKTNRRFPLKEVLIGGVVLGVILGIYLYNKLPKAEIQIWPSVSAVSLHEKVALGTTITAVDVKKLMIPARSIEDIESLQQDFPGTGSVSNDGKASGTITVFNKINPAASLSLKAGTHFLSDSGKYFATTAKITVPAAAYQKGKLVPGSVSVSVQAEDTGPDYNIGPSKFSVPKLSGTAYYYTVWAESQKSMAGGHIGQAKQVTQDDIQHAQDVLVQKLTSQARDAIAKKLAPNEILADSAIVKDTPDASSSVDPDTIADTFTETVKLRLSAVVFKKDDLAAFVADDITGHLANDQTYLQQGVATQYNLEKVDTKSGAATLNLDIGATSYKNINTGDLGDLVAMKSASQIKDIVSQLYSTGIDSVVVRFWPFWVHRTPSEKIRTTIDLKFSQ